MAVHHAVGISCQKNSGYHSLLRQTAAQKQEKHSSKMKNIHHYRREIKRKTIKSKSEPEVIGRAG